MIYRFSLLAIMFFSILLSAAEAPDEQNLVSAGSIILVRDNGELKILLGKRHKPGLIGHQTFGSFHGNIIRQEAPGIYDQSALLAAKRNLVWEMMMLDGDPTKFPTPKASEDLLEQQNEAQLLLAKLCPVARLKNKSWEQSQRPNFVFVVEYEDIKYFVENFAKHRSLKNSRWEPEICELRLFDAQAVLESIRKHVEDANDPINLVPYGSFAKHDDVGLYDALSRTIAVSIEEFSQVISLN